MRPLSCCIIGLCGFVGLAAAPVADGAAVVDRMLERQQTGIAIATVYHSVTGEVLAGMPVVVRELIDPDLVYTGVFKTDQEGRVVLGPLESGHYTAFVSFNNRVSEAVIFEINGDTDFVVTFSLFFNPDEDG